MSRKRGTLEIIKKLLVFARPFYADLAIAVISGTLAFLLKTGISVFATLLILNKLINISLSIKNLAIITLVFVLLRGAFRFLEQYMNHLVAFKVLCFFRDKVFIKIRQLAPAKLQGINNGDLISMITSDIELLEVFYAHTITPISIALLSSIIYLLVAFSLSFGGGIILMLGYLFVGIALPYFFSKWSNRSGLEIRKSIGLMNNTFLDILRGITEIMQFSYEKKATAIVKKSNKNLVKNQNVLIKQLAILLSLEDSIAIITTFSILIFAYTSKMNFFLSSVLAVGVFYSFGPVFAVASLGNGLSQTLACGDRVIDLFDQVPVAKEICNGKNIDASILLADDKLIEIQNLSFSYGENEILKNLNIYVKKNEIMGIRGESGCGKSTLLKMIMRFWTPDTGKIKLGGLDLENINTKSLWDNISYMTQTTEFFEGTIRDNLLIAKSNASDDEIYKALEEASILDFINKLEYGLDTFIAEVGDNFSGGERQRLGLARCFLKNAPILLLDEPTSNLDVLNEQLILRAIKNNIKNKTVILVSHRESTLKICDRIVEMEEMVNGQE